MSDLMTCGRMTPETMKRVAEQIREEVARQSENPAVAIILAATASELSHAADLIDTPWMADWRGGHPDYECASPPEN